MTQISQIIFDKFQVRKTKAQKTAFLNFMKQQFPDAIIEEGGFPKNRNLVIGDVKNAKVVLGAHYDTCSALPFPNFLTPKNIPVYILFTLLISAILLAILFPLYRLVNSYIDDPYLALLARYGVLFLFLYLLTSGPANPHTANDNTSGIITLCEIMARLTPEQRSKTAFVFFDNEESGLRGSAFFRKKHKQEMKTKLFINFDCVSDGDNFLLVQNKPARERFEAGLRECFPSLEDKTVLLERSSRTFYPSDQLGFPMYIGIAAFRKNKIFGLYVSRIHTPRDTVFDQRNIDHLASCTARFISHLS